MKKKCERCKKVTAQVNTSEGFGGLEYYEDYTCTVCNKVNCFETKKRPNWITHYSVSTGGY